MPRRLRSHFAVSENGRLAKKTEQLPGWFVGAYSGIEFSDLRDAVDHHPRHELRYDSNRRVWELANPWVTGDLPLGAWVVKWPEPSGYFAIFETNNDMGSFEEWTEGHGWLWIRQPDRTAALRGAAPIATVS